MGDRATTNDAQLVVEDRFSIVPEWLLDADISDAAVRLYAVLLRYGQSSGARMPSRSTLARRLRKRSVDSVDRAMRDLVRVGAVTVEARYAGGQRLTNLYQVRTSGVLAAVSPAPRPGGGRTSAATRAGAASVGRRDAAGVAARVRQDPESSTQSPPPPVSAAGVAGDCGIDDWQGFVDRCTAQRRLVGAPVGRWRDGCLEAALRAALARGWPAAQALSALLGVAADRGSRSPMRVAEAGPWWDRASDEPAAGTAATGAERVSAMQQELAELGGARVMLQRQARAELTREGLPLTRATVTVRAYELHVAARTPRPPAAQ